MKLALPCCLVAGALGCLAGAPLPAGSLIPRPSVAQFADPDCMVKQREAKTAELGNIEEIKRADGCVAFKGSDGKTFYLQETSLKPRGATVTCKPKAGGAPVAMDMAGTTAGGTKLCP